MLKQANAYYWNAQCVVHVDNSINSNISFLNIPAIDKDGGTKSPHEQRSEIGNSVLG